MPKRFFFWEALPKSGYGKVPKRLVRDELEARGELDWLQEHGFVRRIEQPGPAAPERMHGSNATACASR